MTSSGSSPQFPSRLRTLCEDFAEKYGYKRKDLGRGFEGYLAHLFARESGFEEVLEGQDPQSADLSDVILRTGDLGVDVVLEDSENRQLLLVQAKWSTKNAPFPLDSLQSFFSIHPKLCEHRFIATGGDMARELLGSYADKVRDKYTVVLRFVTNRPLSEGVRWKEIRDSANEGYDKADARVQCEVFGQAELKELEQQVESTGAGILSEISFPVKENDVVEFHDPNHSLICRLSGNVLTSLYGQYRQELFALNIRLPMALGRAINKEIRNTAEHQPHEFFFYNNGVSAVCSDFIYDTDQNLVKANRFQIINGAQTVGAIAGAGSTEHLTVLFRLTATGDRAGGAFTDSIIRYNNTQNPIQISDFRSNDEIQNFLKEYLTRRSGKGAAPSFVYRPKRSARTTSRGGTLLTSDQLARIRYSFIYGPVRTYKEPKLLFDISDSGLYWDAFGDEGNRVNTWTEPQLDEATVAIALDFYFKDLGNRLKKAAKESGESNDSISDNEGGGHSYGEANYLYRLSRYLMALAAVGLRIHQGQVFEDYRELLSSTKRFGEVTNGLIQDARQLVRIEMGNRTAGKPEAQPDYNLARDATAWARLSKQMRVEARVRLTDSP